MKEDYGLGRSPTATSLNGGPALRENAALPYLWHCSVVPGRRQVNDTGVTYLVAASSRIDVPIPPIEGHF
jgi:hypothetical protein